MPGLPKNLLSTYQKYKKHTDSIAQWLATTAKARGYSSPKSKSSSKSAKVPQGKQTYTIPMREWTPMAAFIAGLIDPPVTVPVKLAALLDTTISLRQSYSEDITESLKHSPDQDSNNRHAFFLNILKSVRSVLSPLMSEAHAATKKLNTTNVKDILNIFEHLELEEPSAAFEQAPDVPSVSTPIYHAERPNDIEEDFFVFYLLLQDLSGLRAEVSKAWAAYKDGKCDLISASITTNTAVDLARSMVEDSGSIFNRRGGAIRMLQIYYASACLEAGTTQTHRQSPTDDMNFAMYKTADAMFWPAYILLLAFFITHQKLSHPQLELDGYGTYDPASVRDGKSDRDKFIEDKILLLDQMLPEFYTYCLHPTPVEDEFTRLLRTMFETKEVQLPLVFATTLFLDIHHTLRAEVDYGLKRLTDATRFIVNDIREEIVFHRDIQIETWPKQNNHVLQHFVDAIEFWVHEDQQRKLTLRLKRTYPPEPFYLYRKHPWICGLWRYWALMRFHELGIAFANASFSIMACAHLYNAVSGGKTQDPPWKDLEFVIGLQESKTFFIGEAPIKPDECYRRFSLAMGVSAATFTTSTSAKRGSIYSKKGPKEIKELGTIMQAFKGRICDINGPKNIRAEDLQKILENSPWQYELDDSGNARRIFKEIGGTPKTASAGQLSISNCIGLIGKLIHRELIEVAFDYFRLHRNCWHLLRAVKDHVHNDLIFVYGPDYTHRESTLPSIVGYVLMTASRDQEPAKLLRGKLPDVQVASKVQESARYAVKDFVASGAGNLIVEQILPQAFDLHMSLE